MRQRTILATLVVTLLAMALVAEVSGGGSAATKADQPSKQELARKLLETKGVQLTPAARGFVTRMAAGGERAAEPEGTETPSAKAGTGTSTGVAAAL
jgi:hypothetical protein